MALNISKYKDVNYKSLKSSAENALREITTVDAQLKTVQNDLKNTAVLPNGIGRVLETALDATINPTTGLASIGVLKSHFKTLSAIAVAIERSQLKWEDFEKLSEKIKKEKAKKGTDSYDREYYNSLIEKRNQMITVLLQLETNIDTLVKKLFV
ncbi:MAG: hypothetical protein HFI09_01705 [Bacilli bacterium]|nr:hypothetical protein [Bacilli bacterium]